MNEINVLVYGKLKMQYTVRYKKIFLENKQVKVIGCGENIHRGEIKEIQSSC